VETLVAKIEVMIALMLWCVGFCIWQESGVWSQAVGFMAMRFAGVFVRSDEVFTFNLLSKNL
jgi:hypothetical protein